MAKENFENKYLHELANVIETMTDGVAIIDHNWNYTFVNQGGARMLGRSVESLIGNNLWEEFPDSRDSESGKAYVKAFETQQPIVLNEVNKTKNRWYENRIYPTGEGLTIFFSEVTQRKQLESLAGARNSTLQMIATGAPLSESLSTLLIHIEKLVPGMYCSILVLDDEGKRLTHGAAPSLPDQFCQAIDGGEIGPAAGSCGTAAYRREPVMVEDIATDPLWAGYRELALTHGLRACWSTPIFDGTGDLLGTFAIYYRMPGKPTSEHRMLIESSTDLASIAIKHEKMSGSLRESEERLRLALDSANIGTFDWDIPNDRIIRSHWHEELWGFDSGECDNGYESFTSRVHLDDLALVTDKLSRCIADQTAFKSEFRVVWPNASVHWIHSRGEFQFDEQGEPIRMRGVVVEISEQKVAEHELIETASRLEQAQRIARLGFAGWDIQKKELYFSEEARFLFGFAPEEIPTDIDSVLDWVHSDDAQFVRTNFVTALKGGPSYNIQHRIVRRDGTIIWVKAQAELTLDSDGNPEALLGTLLDVTELIQAQKDRESSLGSEREARFGAETLAAANVAISKNLELDDILTELLDHLRLLVPYDSGYVLLWSDETHLAVNSLRGYEDFTNAEETKKITFDVTDGNVITQIITSKRSVIVDDTRICSGWERPAGAEHVISWMGIPLITSDQVIGVYSVDKITPNFFTEEHRRRAEALSSQGAAAIQNALLHKRIFKHAQELEYRVAERTSELAVANKELEAFSYSISHDLRAPLRHISGFSQALLAEYDQVLDEKGKTYLMHLGDASKEMAKLIDDVLDLAKVTRGAMHRERVDLSSLAHQTLQQLQTDEPQRIVDIKVEKDMTTRGDARLLGLVLSNLLGNAWKFTSKKKRGKIVFGRARSKDDPIYFVRDNGAGFDMEYADKLFGAFQRLHSANEFEGTGIGLASAHRIISRHGGRIWAKSSVDRGATIYFSLPDNHEE